MSRIGFNTPSALTAMGGYGFQELIASSPVTSLTDRFAIIQAKGDTNFSFVNDVPNGILTDASFTMIDGDVLYGFFHSINVASGKLRVYFTQE